MSDSSQFGADTLAGTSTIAWPADAALQRAAQPSWLRIDLAVALVGLLVLMAWEVAGFDLLVSRHYGSAHGFGWRDAWLTRALLHDGGRALGWVVFAFMLGRAWRPADDDALRRERWHWVGVTLLCVLLVPTIKRLTASSCPWDLTEFGGVAAYVPHWRLGLHDGGPGHCFPSGHAVAAFAFLTLYFGERVRRPWLARLSLAAVCLAGVAFGWGQLARGAHYVSHTLWSAWLCWVVCAVAAQWPSRRRPVSASG